MRRLDVFQEYGDDNLLVDPKTSVGQTFKALHNNLAGIRFSVSNTNLGGKNEYIFSILNDKKDIIRTFTAKESNLGWQTTFRYDFPPIADSSGKTYTLDLSFTGGTPSGELAKRDVLKIAYSPGDLYKDGYALENGKPLSGDLTFSTYYDVNAREFLRDSFSDFKGRLLQDKLFLLIYAAVLAVLFLSLFARIIRKK